MIKYGSTVSLKDTYQQNYPKLFSVSTDPLNPLYVLRRRNALNTDDQAQQLTFELVNSVSGNPKYLFIGDTVRLKSDFQADGGPFYAAFNFTFMPYAPTTDGTYDFIICTRQSYCNANTDPKCLNPVKGTNDYGNPVCLHTEIYLYKTPVSGGSGVNGYVNYGDLDAYALSTDGTEPIPPAQLAGFWVVPQYVSTCDSNKNCVRYNDFDVGYVTITCDTSCTCKDKNGNYIFVSNAPSDCNCANPSVTTYYCNTSYECAPIQGSSGTDLDTCKKMCIQPNTYDCNVQSNICELTVNGKYGPDPTCGGKCDSGILPINPVDNNKKKSSNKTTYIILVILIILVFGGIGLYFYMKRRRNRQ